MLDKLRKLERLLEPGQNDYLSALRERIHPIKGKASLGIGVFISLGQENGDGSGNPISVYTGNGWGDEGCHGDGGSIANGDGPPFGYINDHCSNRYYLGFYREGEGDGGSSSLSA